MSPLTSPREVYLGLMPNNRKGVLQQDHIQSIWAMQKLKVKDNTRTIFENCVLSTISFDRATKAPGLQEGPGTNGETRHTSSVSQVHTNEAKSRDGDQSVVDKIVRHGTENCDTKYVV